MEGVTESREKLQSMAFPPRERKEPRGIICCEGGRPVLRVRGGPQFPEWESQCAASHSPGSSSRLRRRL